MFNASTRRGRRTLITAVFVALVLALGAARFDVYFRSPMLEKGDIAVNALQIDQAKRFSEIYGNYSRFEFNHPGPAFFYVYAAGEWVLCDLLHLVPSPANAHLLACMALQSLFFALAIGVLCSHLEWPALPPLALFAGAVYFGLLADPFVSIWPPHVLLMPFLCFLIAGTSVASGRTDDWPLVVLAGAFLFHGHVAQSLFVGGLGGLALAFSLWRLRPAADGSWREVARTHRGLLVLCATVVFVFLAPLALDLLMRGSRSNVATIIGRYNWTTHEQISALRSLLYFLSFGTTARNQDELFAAVGPEARVFLAGHAWPITAWVAVLVVPPVLAWRWRQRLSAGERRFILTAGTFIAAGVLGCIVWGTSQAGGMHHFNGYFYYAIYYFGLLLALALTARSLPRFPLLPASLLAIAAAVVVVRLFAAKAPSEDEAGLALQRGVVAALAADSGARPKLLVFEHVHWHNVAAVALALQRRGVEFYMAPWWNFMFQPRHDVTRLGPVAEDHASVWWITAPTADGVLITPELAIHVQPGAIRPDGGEIRLRGGDNGFRYLVSGLAVGNVEYAATNLPRTAFQFVPQTAPGDVSVVFDAAAYDPTRERHAAVFFNRELVGRVAAGARAAITVRVPAALWNRQPIATLELRFAEPIPHINPERPDYESWSAWHLWSIRFESG